MMIFLKKFVYGIIDSCFAWFTPSWRKKGCAAAQSIRRYVNMNRHSLSEENLKKCCDLLARLDAALLAWNGEKVRDLEKEVDRECVPMQGFARGSLVEIVESFFIIMVVFLGIRTYYAQPFRIPTGSMQPSLNGITVVDSPEIPATGVRIWNMLQYGSSFIDVSLPKEDAQWVDLVSAEQRTKYVLFTETVLTFVVGTERKTVTVSVPSAKGAVMEYLTKYRGLISNGRGSGTLTRLPQAVGDKVSLMRAWVNAGDMVIVNRLAYHFRKPVRGETFVFDTRGIDTNSTGYGYSNLMDQSQAQHYIKRLCGLPGDSLRIERPFLYVNGKVAEEPTIARVAARKKPYNAVGYLPVSAPGYLFPWLGEEVEQKLWNPKDEPILRCYAALGDNTVNSLDSRYWGPVRQFNLVGPAGFALWPFTEHWGWID